MKSHYKYYKGWKKNFFSEHRKWPTQLQRLKTTTGKQPNVNKRVWTAEDGYQLPFSKVVNSC